MIVNKCVRSRSQSPAPSGKSCVKPRARYSAAGGGRELAFTMDKLPTELLFKIMLYLPPVDRLSCSLTCRRFAEAISSPELSDGVWLNIAGHEMKAAASILVDSPRLYSKLVLSEVDLSEFEAEFWEKVGPNLRTLELDKCPRPNHVFYAILKQCTKLEFLRVVEYASPKISVDDFVPPGDVCHDEIRNSLSHLRHLHLDIGLTAETLDLLLGLMPNVTSLFLSPRYDDESDFMERLPSILQENRIIRVGANFHRMEIGSENVAEFVGVTAGSLEELQIDATELTESACDAIANCTNLRSLTLKYLRTPFNASHFKKLVSNSPDLETLELYNIEDFKAKDLEHFSELKKLRDLTLRGPLRSRIASRSLCSLREISTLVKLDLKGLDVDSKVIRSIGCLTQLRSLALDACSDSECLEAICENFGRLTELDLGRVKNLRDADGMKLCRFKELRSLNFSLGFGFTDLTFKSGVGSREMISLVIEGCSLTNTGLMSIASHHNRLEKLVLEDCKKFDDAGIGALLQDEPRLKELYLIDCVAVRNDWSSSLRNLCPRLRRWWIHSNNSD